MSGTTQVVFPDMGPIWTNFEASFGLELNPNIQAGGYNVKYLILDAQLSESSHCF